MIGMLKGKVALVTGAARGIGRGAAQIFAREGAQVVISDISADGLRETAELIRSSGGEATAVVADVANAADVSALVETAATFYGRLDCAFNNAGITAFQAGAGGKLTADWPEEAFDQVIQVNVKGVWLCMRAEIAQMTKQGNGSIVNTASLASFSGFRTLSGYAASKHAVVGLTKTAAVEYAPTIRVNCICPGYIDSVIAREALARRGDDILARLPFHRMGTPDDTGEMACWLLSDRAQYVTGSSFNVDGGYLAG
jgi:NAD(P)-dependent dehydrogenase (short-subunit alcohol dehydrogenase family)